MNFKPFLRLPLGLRSLMTGLFVAALVLGACAPITAPADETAATPPPQIEEPLEEVPVEEEAVEEESETEIDELSDGALGEPGEITLAPYTDPVFNIDSMVPEGWVQVDNGVFIRQASPTDVTLIAQQSVQLDAETLLFALMPQLGLSEPPESVGTHEGTLEWTLYNVEIDAEEVQIVVDLALAESEGHSYLLLLQSSPADTDELYANVFLPTLDVLAPLTAQADAGPLPYDAEDVTFENDDITLAGTLTLPPSPGPHPVVILVSGSGPQDRDATLAPNIPIRPFALLADGLTQAGIAVLRYDDRGVGQSTGDFAAASIPDFAEDAEAAIRYLQTRPEIDSEQIGLLGHSEGGIVAAILGADNEDLAFLITLAGPGVSGLDVLLLQNRLIFESEGATPEEIEAQLAFVEAMAGEDVIGDPEAIEALAYPHILSQLENLPPQQLEQLGDVELFAAQSAAQLAQEYSAGWFQSFIQYEPADDWAQVTLPVLAVYGARDLQIEAEQNAPAVEAALEEAGNEEFEVVILGDANHLFQAAQTGAVSEYAMLAPEFTPELMPLLISWLNRYVEIDEALGDGDAEESEAVDGDEDNDAIEDSESTDNDTADSDTTDSESAEDEAADDE